MANDGQVVFEVSADGSTALQQMRQLTRDIQHETENWDDAAEEASDNIGNSFTSMLKKVGSAIAAAKIGQKLIEIGKEAINLASDLEEVQNVVDVTFGSDANQIDKWAKDAATQFGLTEIQAKKFTSTLGAMMKSSGLAGSEITDMSTQLSGLAADMASFYNLDFEEAFNKIRSGISGETEPLKQLGINMSVANLNAFALKQGLEKTFDQMTQGEQIMLRYQYLMSATSDAQGDFARTSDGYANSLRQVETNITSLKTNIGKYLLPAVNDVVNAINGLFGSDAQEKADKFSILDRINEIQIEKEEKIAQIEAIAGEARALIEVLSQVTGEDAGAAMTAIANGANALASDSPANWSAVLGALSGINGLENLFGENSDIGTVDELAKALSGQGVSTTKAQAWQTFLGALANNADAVSKLTGTSADETKAWLEEMATAAGELSPEDAAAWDTLMSSLISGMDLNTEEGQAFVEKLAQQFLAMGSGSEEAAAGLAALGYSTQDVEAKQAEWLAICKELAQTIPGIGDLIDKQTGEIKGGIPALQDYVDEWEKVQKIQAELEGLEKMKAVYEQENNEGTKRGEMAAARGVLKKRLEKLIENEQELADLLDFVGVNGLTEEGSERAEKLMKDWSEDRKQRVMKNLVDVMHATVFGDNDKLMEGFQAYVKAVDVYLTTVDELPVVQEEIAETQQELQETYDDSVENLQALVDANKEAEQSMTTLERAASGEEEAFTAVETAVSNANDAITAMADHVQTVRDKISSTLDGMIGGFAKFEYSSNKAKKTIDQLTAEQAQYKIGSDEWKAVQVKIDEQSASLVNRENMMEALRTQEQFIDDYLANLKKAQELGLSNELLASLADGSAESAEYLAALVADGTGATAKEIDEAWQKIQGKKGQLEDALTQQQLTVDDIYNELAERAKKAIAELDMGDQAAENSGKTIEGVARGISEKVPAVQSAVDSVIAQLARLEGWGINLGNFGSINYSVGGAGVGASIANGVTLYSHANGLDWVPYDNYFARLHEGEAVLTAEENKVWQRYRNGNIAGMDYDRLGGVMRDSVRPGGNVYLDGKIVGSVISDVQGRSYRQLQRSGWQS